VSVSDLDQGGVDRLAEQGIIPANRVMTTSRVLVSSQAMPRSALPQVMRSPEVLSLALSATGRTWTSEAVDQGIDVAPDQAVRLDGQDAHGGQSGLSRDLRQARRTQPLLA
jgi:hypothetical protein